MFDQNNNTLIYVWTGSLVLNNFYYLTGSYHNSLINISTNFFQNSYSSCLTINSSKENNNSMYYYFYISFGTIILSLIIVICIGKIL